MKATRPLTTAALALAALAPVPALAGGGPANVMVLYNAASPEAAAVAEYYAQARSIPSNRLCALHGVEPNEGVIPFARYDTTLRADFEQCLQSLQDAAEIDYLVLIRGLPYQVTLPNGSSVGLTALFQVHRAADDLSELAERGQYRPPGGSWMPWVENPLYPTGGTHADYELENPYANHYPAASALAKLAALPPSFRRATAPDGSGFRFKGNLFVVTRLDGFDFNDARALVDRAVQGDGTFPSAPLICLAGVGEARSARDPECEFAMRMLQGAGFNAQFRTPFDAGVPDEPMAAFFTGAEKARDVMTAARFVPGAITCNLTSFGAVPENFHCSEDGQTCPAVEKQTSVNHLVRSGATGVHGTVAEPYNHSFPSAAALMLYTAGYSLGESYLMSQRFLYWHNLVLGDPLAAPYAKRPQVTIERQEPHPSNWPVRVRAAHDDGVAKVALYRNGAKLAEAEGDTLEVQLPGAEGEQHQLLAVAVARNATVSRPGWSHPEVLAANDVQGWTTDTVTLGAFAPLPEPEPDPDSNPNQEDGEGAEAASCGCSTPSGRSVEPAALTLLVLFGLGLAGRSRRSRA